MTLDESAMRLLMLQAMTEQLWALVLTGGRDRETAMAAVEQLAHAGRGFLETTSLGSPEITHSIARMQDEFWASVRQRVAMMTQAES